MVRRVWMCGLLALVATGMADAQTISDRLQWKLVTDGTAPVGDGGEATSSTPAPNLAGSNATFLFQLDFQPLLNVGKSGAKKSFHAQFETGVIGAGRTVVTKAEPGLSASTSTLALQGVTVSGTPTEAPSLTHQRAFTAGGEVSANRTFDADNQGTLAELGVVGKLHYDAFIQDDQFFEEDGLTYVKVAGQALDSAFVRSEVGLRFRVSQNDEKAVAAGAGTKGGNTPDLLLIEWLYQYNGALKGLVAGEKTENRSVFRFVATPRLPNTSNAMKRMKLLLGIEVNDDFGAGYKDVRVFYGTNVDIGALFD